VGIFLRSDTAISPVEEKTNPRSPASFGCRPAKGKEAAKSKEGSRFLRLKKKKGAGAYTVFGGGMRGEEKRDNSNIQDGGGSTSIRLNQKRKRGSMFVPRGGL